MAISVEPQSAIYLCKTPLEEDYKNQLTFATKSAQTTYFNSTVQHTFTNYTFIRAESSIKVDMNVEKLRGCNYLFYQNNGFLDDNNQVRTYYCFITKLEYIDESTTKIHFSTDCFQTWYFDIVYKPCFVEREHVADDTAGANTVPEGLETGEYEIVDVRHSVLNVNPASQSTAQEWLPCFCVTKYPTSFANLDSTTERIKGDLGYIGYTFSSLKFFTVNTLEQARWIINLYDSDMLTTANAIVNIYMIPRCCANTTLSGDAVSYFTYRDATRYPLYPIKNYYESDEYNIQQPNVLAGQYEPVNKKLFAYPYSYFYATNNAGEQVDYHWEDFPIETIGTGTEAYTARTARYEKHIVPSCGISGKLFFLNYKGYNTTTATSYTNKLYSYGISFGKLPVCAWQTDYYTNWLTQNGVNMAFSSMTNITTSAVGGALAGMAVPVIGGVGGAVIGGTMSLLQEISKSAQQLNHAETTPPQAKGDTNAGDFGFCFKRNIINFYFMSVRPEMARILDNYFTMFGYKVNVVKTPQFNSRQYWNYVKTIGCNAEGNIPQEDLQTIRNMFDKGCTFWHGASNMYDYSLANNIVS